MKNEVGMCNDMSELESVLLTIKIISEQINALSEKVGNLNDRMGIATEKIGKLNGELDLFKQYINRSIEDLQAEVKKLKEKDIYNSGAQDTKRDLNQPKKEFKKTILTIFITFLFTLLGNFIVKNYFDNLKGNQNQQIEPTPTPIVIYKVR
jgi:predicted  nucleic acid-binding Zn-ribbon protein